MEENKKNDQLDDELDVELDEEDAEDGSEDDLDEDLEEYDIGDDEDGDDEEADLGGDDDDPDEDGEGQAPEADAAAEDGAKAPEDNADGQQAAGDERVRAMMEDMLDRLGYRGTYEEKMAAYEADAAATGEDKADGGKSGEDAEVDYRAMAEADLRDINAAFGTRHTDFSAFRNVERFAQLRMGGATALEAYRATQPDITQPGGEGQAGQALGKPSISHIKPLPKGGQGGSSLSVEDQRMLAQLREFYPKIDLAKKLDKIRRGR